MKACIISTTRTPFAKANGALAKFDASALGVHVVTQLILKTGINPTLIDELIFGSVLHSPHLPHLAREVILQSGLPKSMVAHTVSNNCITGLSSLAWGFDAIKSGRCQALVVGGVESMSHPSITFNEAGHKFFLGMNKAKSFAEKLKLILGLRPSTFAPKPPSPAEPSTGLTMGQHCEVTVKELKISREAQDNIALLSHQKAAAGAAVLSEEISEIAGIKSDSLVRADTTLEKLEALKPVFDKTPEGTITAGNASSLTDGASAVLLVSEDFALKNKLEVLAWVEGIEFAALPPGDGLLMAPGLALPRLLSKLSLEIGQVDCFEIHEAFAGQVLANLKVWRDGWKLYPDIKPIGEIDPDKMNRYGGSLALGHPFAATGGRMLGTLARELKRKGLNRGVISICAAGGLAAAVSLRR